MQQHRGRKVIVPEPGGHPELYSGADLANACEKSITPRSVGVTRGGLASRLTAAGWAVRAVLHHLRRTARNATSAGGREISCRGVAEGSKERVETRYVGKSRNFAFLMDACLSEYEVTAERSLSPLGAFVAARRRGNEDLLLVDMETTVVSPGDTSFRIAPWLKQRVHLRGTWSDFIATLSRKTRQELSRYLRKFGYQARLNDTDAAYSRFYDEFYLPHVSRRYGDQAVLADKKSFDRHRTGTCIVELLYQGEVVGANIVRTSGNCLYILWCGFSADIEDRGLKGVADVLDYFSILYAACRGLTWVDLGRSRPRLNDGLLVYKSKWGAAISQSRLKAPPIRILPRNLHGATTAVLARNSWIVRCGPTLEGRIIVDDGVLSKSRVREIHRRYLYEGIERVRVGATKGIQDDVDIHAWSAESMDVTDLSEGAEPLEVFLRE